ncbi:MAG: ABC transporter permease [Magnetococcales bacterium]|nr:ABC transporter permease [Magnetococcales bacterium]
MTASIQRLGRTALGVIREMGRMALFLAKAVGYFFLPPFRPRNLLRQIHFIGLRSLFVICLTAVFSGFVLSLLGYYTLSRFGSSGLLGPAVAFSVIRELGPVLSGLMVTGLAGSALTAELGIMRIREQLDALEIMGIQPVQYLVVPRIQAALISLPVLTMIFDVIGILGGYVEAVHLLGMSGGTFIGAIELGMTDIGISLVKAVTFGLIISWVCTYKGFYALRGAEGVSQATTSAVVLSSVLILVSDYFITSMML